MPSLIPRYFRLFIFGLVSLVAYKISFAQTASIKKPTNASFEISQIGEYFDDHQYPHKVYVAQETSGYLEKLGDGIGLNTLIDVGENEYLIVDPGPDKSYAKKILHTLAKIESGIGTKKLILVNTVARPEHVLANSSLALMKTRIYGTKVTRDSMKIRCPNCRKRLATQLENKQILRTPIKIPNQIISNEKSIREFPAWQLFEYIGRTESDLVLWNQATGILYTGGLTYQKSIPDLSSANSNSWLEALNTLIKLEPTYIIGVGRGKISPNTTPLIFTIDYLQNLVRAAKNDFLNGGDAASADKCCKLEQYSSIAGYQTRHALNVQHVWREIEQEEMNQ